MRKNVPAEIARVLQVTHRVKGDVKQLLHGFVLGRMAGCVIIFWAILGVMMAFVIVDLSMLITLANPSKPMQKSCQIISEEAEEVYCKEVYKRTGYHHFVDIKVCQKCTPEIIRELCVFVNMAHKKLIKKKPKIHRPPPTFNEMNLDYNRLKKAIQNKDPGLSGPTIKDVVPWETYLEHRKICIKCYGGHRCPHFCCGIKAELALTTWECKAKKFSDGAIAVTN